MSVTGRTGAFGRIGGAIAAALLTTGAAGLNRLTPAEVRAKLGEPAVARAEAAGALWTYRLPKCALFVYFSDEGQGLKVSGAESGPRRYGETQPDADACLADPGVPAPTEPIPTRPVPVAPGPAAPGPAAPGSATAPTIPQLPSPSA